jgi:glycerol-3-phosphate dehydrogenase
MVKEALAERANLIEIAPHLSYPFPIMLPVYKYFCIILDNHLDYNKNNG